MTKKAMTFEASMERLEEIVRTLDAGSEGLDESLKLYAEGMELVRRCTKELETAEQKVRMLQMQPDGSAALVDFPEDGGNAQ